MDLEPSRDDMLFFAKNIDAIVSANKCNYIEAVLDYCEIIGMEIEVAASLINPNLKSKIENDALQCNLLKSTGARLPI